MLDHQRPQGLKIKLQICYTGVRKGPFSCSMIRQPFPTRQHTMQEFRPQAPSAETVFYRTYSRRKEDGTRENFQEAMTRTVEDIGRIGKFTEEELALVKQQALAQHSFPSGRAFWVAGTEWGQKQENFSGYYNCTSTHMGDLNAFGLLVDLAMQGSGTGAVLEQEVVDQLPPVKNILKRVGGVAPGAKRPEDRQEHTSYETLLPSGVVQIRVGDSRHGWREAYQLLINLAFNGLPRNEGCIRVFLDLSSVRPAGERLKGFGGTSNPVKLEVMFDKIINLLNEAHGRQLTTVEACLLIDEAAACIVAGNIRRSAGMRQFSQTDSDAATAKLGLYTQDEDGNWRVDPRKEALRMANHTRCYHTKPSYEEVKAAVELQFSSGEGAIQYVPEAVARANADILNTLPTKRGFLELYAIKGREAAKRYLSLAFEAQYGHAPDERELQHRMDRYGLNPCGEIIGRDFHCNLAEVHLNTIDPSDYDAQHDAFYAAGLQVAALLQHEFVHERYQYSRSIDPIVGVSFTGLFDFLVHAGGYGWLEWMMGGRQDNTKFGHQEAYAMYTKLEEHYLKRWRESAHEGVRDYCETAWHPPAQPHHHRAACRHQELADGRLLWLASPEGSALHPSYHPWRQ